MLRCREAFEALARFEWMKRCTVTTVDAAQGLEAEHLILVFLPRPSDRTLNGIQRDPGRFYQATMRSLATCEIFVEDEALTATVEQGTRNPPPRKRRKNGDRRNIR